MISPSTNALLKEPSNPIKSVVNIRATEDTLVIMKKMKILNTPLMKKLTNTTIFKESANRLRLCAHAKNYGKVLPGALVIIGLVGKVLPGALVMIGLAKVKGGERKRPISAKRMIMEARLVSENWTGGNSTAEQLQLTGKGRELSS